MEYVGRGYYIGLTGTICKKERGAPPRGVIPNLLLERLMVEMDGPFMGFNNEHRCSEPAHELNVVRKLAETINVPFEQVCEVIAHATKNFFQIQVPI